MSRRLLSLVLLVLLVLLPLVACQALENLKKNLERTGKEAVEDVTGKPADDAGIGAAAQTFSAAVDTAVKREAASEDSGWTFSQVEAGEYGLAGGTNADGRPRLLVDPACPTAFAVVGMQGSRWKVTFRGQAWGGFDGVHGAALYQPGLHGRGYAISPDGMRFGFLASRDGKRFYVIDGVEGPTAEANKHGSLVFSDDSASYAYTIGNSDLIVDGELVGGDPTDKIDTVGGLGFAAGTHDLHYFRLVKPQAAGGQGGYLIVSGGRRFQSASTAGVAEPAFLEDGTPYWYENVEVNGRGTLQLVMDGKPLPGVGRLSDPTQSTKRMEGSPDLVAEIVGEGAERPLVGFYVIKDGQVRSFDIPESVHDEARHIRMTSLRVAPDHSRLAYQLRNRVVVGDVVSHTYETIGHFGFTASGRCVATAWQGGRLFFLVDGVEQERGWELNTAAELLLSTRHDRVTIKGTGTGGALILVGTVDSDGLTLEEQDLDGWTIPRFGTSEDGSTLICLSTKYENARTSSAVMRDLKPFIVEGVSAGKQIIASPDGSVVLWDGHVDNAPRARQGVLANEQLLGRVARFRDASFGAGGHYAFSAWRHPEVGQTAKDAAKLPPLLCVDGRFFDGLRILQPGTWVDGTYHVLCARGEGESGEVLMAHYKD